MGQTTIIRNVRGLIDRKKILDAMLRQLLQNKSITPEDLDRIMGITIERVAESVQAQAVSVFVVDKKTKGIKFQNVYYSPLLYGDDPVKKLTFERKAEQLERMVLPPGKGIVGETIAKCVASYVPDVHADKRFNVGDINLTVTLAADDDRHLIGQYFHGFFCFVAHS